MATTDVAMKAKSAENVKYTGVVVFTGGNTVKKYVDSTKPVETPKTVEQIESRYTGKFTHHIALT